jgi:hypothetical protein
VLLPFNFWQISERETFVSAAAFLSSPLQHAAIFSSLKTVVWRLVWQSCCWIIGSWLDSCCCGYWWTMDSLFLVRSVAPLFGGWRGWLVAWWLSFITTDESFPQNPELISGLNIMFWCPSWCEAIKFKMKY